MKHRPLVRHYEIKASHAEAWLQSRIGIMPRKLAETCAFDFSDTLTAGQIIINCLSKA